MKDLKENDDVFVGTERHHNAIGQLFSEPKTYDGTCVYYGQFG